ncbi:MAG: metallophosphoesterase, partial [Deltaproteobacteria bacterium]|nr:metallophosphoesterase [Deltaproteobacteria bacterium]
MPAHLTLAFLSVVSALSCALLTYLSARLPALLSAPAPWASSMALRGALSALVAIYFVTGTWLNPRAPLGRLLAWLSALWMGLLVALTLCAALHHAGVALIGLCGGAPPAWAGGAALALAVCAWLAGVARAVSEPALREVEVRVPGLPEGLRGLKVLQLSDLHVGPTLGRAFTERLAARARALSPDLIAITGDLVDGRVELLRRDVEPLLGLSAPCGVFFVTGNHELISGAGAWVRCVREGGVRVLENEWALCERGGVPFVVAGVED